MQWEVFLQQLTTHCSFLGTSIRLPISMVYHKKLSVVGTLMLKRLTNGALSLCHLQTTAAVVSKIVPRWVYNTTYSSVTYFQKLIEIFTNTKE